MLFRSEDALLHFHNERYELLAWCVMPNHVHVLVHVWQMPLWKTVRSWKHFVQTQARLLAERRPPAFQWQREYWDTFMRDEDQERKAVRYIENNPVKVRLCRVDKEWPFSSARFRNQFHRLLIPAGAPNSDSA